MMVPLFVLFACVHIIVVTGHGYLDNPPSRNSMWRAGFDTPKNYNDMGLNCGGASVQWDTFNGKCGICGDRFDANPGDHEVGGKYVNVDRPLSRCYNKADNVIDISVRITAYHKGYFEFRLCENNNMAEDPSIDCFNNGHLLTIAGTDGSTRYSIQNVKEPSYSFKLDMPEGVTCSQCILRWTYNAGNNYRCDDTGCGIGLGPQEQFINCADIAILEDCSDPTAVTSGPEVTDGPTSENPETTSENPETTSENPETTSEKPETTEEPTQTNPQTTEMYTTESEFYTTFPPVTNNPNTLCWAVGMWEDDSGMDSWCMANCFHVPPYCPEYYCKCGGDDDDFEMDD